MNDRDLAKTTYHRFEQAGGTDIVSLIVNVIRAERERCAVRVENQARPGWQGRDIAIESAASAVREGGAAAVSNHSRSVVKRLRSQLGVAEEVVAEIEECAKAVESEVLLFEPLCLEDTAYNRAIRQAAAAVRARKTRVN